MAQDCLGCVCRSPRTMPSSGRLVLATQVDHTATALRSLARRRGLQLRSLAPGLLSLDAPDPQEFITLAHADLSVVEADEVRCLVLGGADLSEVALLRQALTAPTLSTARARVVHADLVPLFADEGRCFHSLYQPIVDLADRRTLAYEALLRGRAPDGAQVMPDVLFPAAEAAGWTHLIDRVGRTTALRDAGSWLASDELLFINFIPTSIYRPEICLRTTELAAREAGVRLDQLVFEVTEGHQIHDLQHLESVFDYYRSHNCKVALDDLGAGYSSLNTLVRLKPDVVKLDKDIVQALPDATSMAVIAAIVGLTHSYGGQVLAECVETEEQARLATELGVDLGQGWLFGRPERPVGEQAERSRRPVLRPPAAPVAVDPSRPDAAVAVPAQDCPPPATVPGGLSALLVRAVDGSVSGVTVVDVQAPDSPLLYVNDAFEAMTGYSSADVLGRNCRLLQGPATDPEAVAAMSRAVARGEQHRAVLRNHRKDGSAWWNEVHLSPVLDEQGRLTHYLGYQHDVTARVEAEERLSLQASRDGLTGLANRTHLLDRLDAALATAADAGRAVAVLFIDLDGFKVVNDSFGHAAGDAVLRQVAERLRHAVRADDLVCRNGGDEFVVILTDLDPVDAARIARRAADDVAAALRRPFVAGDRQAALSGSVGVAVFPDDAASADRLLVRADAAMYEMKGGRRGTQVRS